MNQQSTMQPAERLAVTFAGGTPDRVPVMPKIWVNVAASLTDTPLREVIENPLAAMQVIVDAAVATGVDGARLFLFPPRSTREEEGRLYETDADGRVIGEIDLQGGLATRLERREDFRLDDPYCVAFHTSWTHSEPLVADLADVKRIAVPDKRFYEQTGHGRCLRQMQEAAGVQVGLSGDCDSATLAFCVSLRGMEQALFDLIDAPRLVHALMDKGTAYAIERGKFNIDHGLRILRLNDSVANMSVISPAQWREFVFPHMKEVCDELHRYCPDVRVYCHICGNVLPVVELLIEAGLNCIAPLDPLGGFTVADVRRTVGDATVLMGGVNTLSFSNCTPDEVRQEAVRCMEEGDRNGRFILGSGCALPHDTKRENIEALVDAAAEFSGR